MNNESILESLAKVMKNFHHLRLRQIKERRFFGGEKGILFCIKDLQEDNIDINPSIISEKTNLKRPTVTAALNSLEEKGYIERKLDKTDRRKFVISFTNKGNDVVNEEKERMKSEMSYVIEKMGEKDILELINLSQKAILIMRNYYDENTTRKD